MIAELFVVGSIAFWILSGVFLLGMYAWVANEKGTGATVTLFAFFGILAAFGNFNVFSWAYANPLMALSYVGAYFGIGVIWSLVKWHFFTYDRRSKYDALKTDFLEENSVQGNAIPETLKAKWRQRVASLAYDNNGKKAWFNNDNINSADDIIPKARRSKARIARWIGYWPISLTWAMIDDVVVGICNRLATIVMALMQSISNRNFKGVENDFTAPNPNQD